MALMESPTYAPVDICRTLWVPLTCDGIADPDNDPFSYCSLIATRLTEQFTAEVIETDPGGSPGRPCNERRVAPRRTGWLAEVDTCATTSPKLLTATGLGFKEDLNPLTGEYIGWGPVEDCTEEVGCGSCEASEEGLCEHKIALITLHRAWCGKKPHPDIAFVAQIHRSLTFEASGTVFATGSGFKSQQTLAATTECNPNFVDPWAIDALGSGVKESWNVRYVDYDKAAELHEDGVLVCGCPSCTVEPAPVP